MRRIRNESLLPLYVTTGAAQQTVDRLAAISAGFRPEPGIGLGQKTPATLMSLLRRSDEYRSNADTASVRGSGRMKRRMY